MYGNDLLTNLGKALQFRSRVILVFLLPVNIVVKVVKRRILIFVIYLYAIVTTNMVMLIKNFPWKFDFRWHLRMGAPARDTSFQVSFIINI